MRVVLLAAAVAAAALYAVPAEAQRAPSDRFSSRFDRANGILASVQSNPFFRNARPYAQTRDQVRDAIQRADDNGAPVGDQVVVIPLSSPN